MKEKTKNWLVQQHSELDRLSGCEPLPTAEGRNKWQRIVHGADNPWHEEDWRQDKLQPSSDCHGDHLLRRLQG